MVCHTSQVIQSPWKPLNITIAIQQKKGKLPLKLARDFYRKPNLKREYVKEPFSPHGRDLVTSSNPPFSGVAKIAVIEVSWKSLSIHNIF